MHAAILKPVAVLILWSLVMLAWLIVARMPALKKAGIDIGTVTGGHPGALDGRIDAKAQWPAHNYIHLMEQPTLFYAAALAIAVMGGGDRHAAAAAWAYTLLRIVHSIVQATYNRVIVRFAFFGLSSLALLALGARAASLAFA